MRVHIYTVSNTNVDITVVMDFSDEYKGVVFDHFNGVKCLSDGLVGECSGGLLRIRWWVFVYSFMIIYLALMMMSV